MSSRCRNVSNRVTNGVILKDVFGGQIKVRLTSDEDQGVLPGRSTIRVG